ncbi:hypothetical protein H4R22_003650 [Coemansia sp. RSA 1290]|nr:hypothetical protein H4R22_003650 [Coemansia sp. RSA 1290]
MQITGKVAVITGGARGFGKRLAEMITEKGGKVVLGDVLPEGAQVAADLNKQHGSKVAVFSICDVCQSSNLESLVALAVSEFGALDIMVNNAGISGTLPWADSDTTSLARTIDINLKAPLEGTRLAVRYFLQNKRPGCVVNVASMMAFFPTEFGPVYGATKSGVVNFTASCATLAQMEPPIRVNAIAPNFADTAMVRDSLPKDNNQVFKMTGILTVDEVVPEFITGAASGFGKRLAETVVEMGGKVVLGDILLEGAQVAASLNRREQDKVAVFQKCDVTRFKDIEALMARATREFGVFDVMVNNAGVVGSLLWTDKDGSSHSRALDINLKAPIEGTRLAVKYFTEMGIPGCVINVSSMMAFFPMEFGPVYGAAKSGLVNFTASCATLAQLNPPIRVNAVAPNYTDTPFICTPLVQESREFDKSNLLKTEEVVAQMVRCMEDERLAGDTLLIIRGKPPLLYKGKKAEPSGILTSAKL